MKLSGELFLQNEKMFYLCFFYFYSRKVIRFSIKNYVEITHTERL